MHTIAIMQPYLLPYIGYFQLIGAVDTFVVYDDVQYMKGGWINRNRILNNGKPAMFTFSLKTAGLATKINERQFSDNYDQQVDKLFRIIDASYKQAPYYQATKALIEGCLRHEGNAYLVPIIQNSLKLICDYLQINTKFVLSSELSFDVTLKGAERVISICNNMKVSQYINPIGGMTLYSKDMFSENGMELQFLKTRDIKYKQNTAEFFPSLSIIDVLMNNSPEQISNILCEYDLV